jgi:hypothetical protein
MHEPVDISRRGGTRGTHHVAADLADPASWPLIGEDFNSRLARSDGSRVVFVHNASALTPLGPRVVALARGIVDTAMQDEIRASDDEAFPDVAAARRPGAKGMSKDQLYAEAKRLGVSGRSKMTEDHSMMSRRSSTDV